jgi:16S rRNA (cytosine967-C5)-methyltransferase
VTPAARLQAAIEVLDLVVESAREDGPPADAIVSRYFKTRRYAGSKDRRAVRELVFRAIRRSAERPESGRSAIIGLAGDDPALLELFGKVRGPEPVTAEDESSVPEAGPVPQWLQQQLSALVGPQEWPALVERAPLDLRVNVARSSREAMQAAFPEASPTPLSPWGLRLAPDTRIDQSSAYLEGLVEVQDEGSQLIALACTPKPNSRFLDLCAGAGGKSLALAAAAPDATVIATDSNRARLSKLAPRAARAGASIETRLLNPPNELKELEDIRGSLDVVLVDAPCSGSGTWRRNPEARWRLTPERLDRLVSVQRRLLDLAAELVRPGGTLVYGVCSLLAREGAGQVADFLGSHSAWSAQDGFLDAGRVDGGGRLLTPAHESTDGFFISRLLKPC